MSTFSWNANIDIFQIIYHNFSPVTEYDSRCFKIINKHYLDYIIQKNKCLLEDSLEFWKSI